MFTQSLRYEKNKRGIQQNIVYEMMRLCHNESNLSYNY